MTTDPDEPRKYMNPDGDIARMLKRIVRLEKAVIELKDMAQTTAEHFGCPPEPEPLAKSPQK
jgi:hypothetical protein